VITVLYFAAAREAAGVEREALPPDAATVRDLRRLLLDRHPQLERVLGHCRIAVQEGFVSDDASVPDGSEVAILPPVSGGCGLFQVVDRAISLHEVVGAVRGPGMGGLVTFTGEVREQNHGKRVLRLEYQAYRPMAEKKLEEIGHAVGRTHGATVAIVHRIGVLNPGEAAVVIACAAPHRTAAFRACEATIDLLKKDVPIWKREVYEDGATWVGIGP
jgi:molybdopterin converting factor subunit 1